MSKETLQFSLHSAAIYQYIQRQSGSLGKALLELVMNCADAGSPTCDVTMSR